MLKTCSTPAQLGASAFSGSTDGSWPTESDRKLAFRVIRESLEAGSLPPCQLTWSLIERWLDLAFTTGGRQRPDHGSHMHAAHSTASLNPTHVLVFIFFIVPVIQDEMVNFSPIFQNDSRLRLFSLWRTPLRLAFRCQISLWPALKSFCREFPEGRLHIIWVREERKWWERWEHREQPTAWPASWK